MNPRIIKRLCREDMTYWAPSGKDDYGNHAYADAVAITGRRIERSFSTNQGQQERAGVQVSVLSVSPMLAGGQVSFSSLADLSSDPAPADDGGYLIADVKTILDHRGKVAGYEAILQ